MSAAEHMMPDTDDVPTQDELIAQLQDEIAILDAQVSALQAGEPGARLALELRAHFGTRQRLNQELTRVRELGTKLASYERQVKRQRALQAELAALLDVAGEHDILARVRTLARGS